VAIVTDVTGVNPLRAILHSVSPTVPTRKPQSRRRRQCTRHHQWPVGSRIPAAPMPEVLATHQRAACMPRVVETDMPDTGGVGHPRPPRRQRVRTQCYARLVKNHTTCPAPGSAPIRMTYCATGHDRSSDTTRQQVGRGELGLTQMPRLVGQHRVGGHRVVLVVGVPLCDLAARVVGAVAVVRAA
jgi:hypothetical protein